jgi:predicted dehydrogenase
LIDEDYIGEVLTCNMSWYQSGSLNMDPGSWWRADKAAGANVFTVGFGHLIDALCMILGEFTEVSAVVETTVKEWKDSVSGRKKDVTAPDNIVVFGRLEGGTTISAHVASVPLHASGYRVEIYGRTGSLFLDASETSSLGTLKLLGAKRENTKPVELKIPDRLTWSHEVAHIESALPVAQMWRRFALTLRDEKLDIPNFKTGLNRHRLMNSVEMASTTGQKQIL